MWDYGEDNRGVELAAISIAMAAVSILAVALRSYTMSFILKRFLIEDWLAVLTCLLQIGFCVIVVIGVSFGLGAHVDNVPEENRPKALIFKWAGQVAYIVVSTLVKFVVGIFLLRLCVNDSRWQRNTIIVLLIVVGLFNIFYVFIATFQCQPIAFYWYRYDPDAPVTGKCNGHTLATIPTYFAVLIGIVADITLALLPATLIKGANLDKKTKISVCCVLALGSLASVATIARIPYAKQLLSNPDYLYNFTDLAIWSIVECGIAITASSLATLRPLFIKMKLLATSHFTQARYGQSKYGSAVIPIQSATVTVVSSSRTRSNKRQTAMSGSTGFTTSTGLTGTTPGLMSVREGSEGIHVEKEFEMSFVTTKTSEDSIDRLEAEVNELINPGSARRRPSHDQLQFPSRPNSVSSRSRPPPLQTPFQAGPAKMLTTPKNAPAGSTLSGHRFVGHDPSSDQSSPQRRPSDGFHSSNASNDQSPRAAQFSVRSAHPGSIGSAYTNSTTALQSPPPLPSDQRRDSEGSALSPVSTFSPPNFHFPTRQSNAYSQSDSMINETRGPIGLSAPPRVSPTDQTEFVANYVPSPLGSPVSLNRRPNHIVGGSPFSQPQVSPASSGRFPFPRHASIEEAPERKKSQRGQQRVSAFLADEDDSSQSSTEGRGNPVPEHVRPVRWPSPRHEMPSPLRSHPPLSPKGNWL